MAFDSDDQDDKQAASDPSAPGTPLLRILNQHQELVGGKGPMRVLWIFGAGASADLGFPLSRRFLRSTLQYLGSHFSEPSELSVNLGTTSQPNQFRRWNGSQIRHADLVAARSDPEQAFDLIHLWSYFQPNDWDLSSRLHYLVRELQRMRPLLGAVGLNPTTAELLDTAPEELLDEIRALDPEVIRERDSRGRDLGAITQAIRAADACVRFAYFYALSEFNDRARQSVHDDWQVSFYEHLVRSPVLRDFSSRIISFNYDTALDEALFWRFTTSWAYERIHIAAINGYPVSPGAEADLLYIKPHGSLNMLQCQNCQRIHIQWFARYVPRGANQPASSNRRCAHCKEPLPGRIELLTDAVVPPLYNKETIDGSTGALRRAFAWANSIVSVGFSFPQQDDYFVQCMADGLAENRSERVGLSLVLRRSNGPTGTEALGARLREDSRIAPFVASEQLAIYATDIGGCRDLLPPLDLPERE